MKDLTAATKKLLHFSAFFRRFSVCWTHLRGVGLHGGQVVLQSQAAVVVEYGLHPGKMRLHHPLPLSSDLLLQRLQHGLEVLAEER